MNDLIIEIPEIRELKNGVDARRSLELYKRAEKQLSERFMYIAAIYIYVSTEEIKQRFPDWDEDEVITEEMLVECRVYVGQSKNIKQRIICFSSSRKYAGNKFEAEREINKNGRVDGYKYKILELYLSNDIMELQILLNKGEKKYAEILRAIDKGYNTAKPGCVNYFAKERSILEPFKLELKDIPLMLTDGEYLDFEVYQIDVKNSSESRLTLSCFKKIDLKTSKFSREEKHMIKNEIINKEWLTKSINGGRYRYVSVEEGYSLYCAIRGYYKFINNTCLDEWENNNRFRFIEDELYLLGVEDLNTDNFYLGYGPGCGNANACCKYRIIKTDTKTTYKMVLARSIADLSKTSNSSYSTVYNNVRYSYSSSEYDKDLGKFVKWRYCELYRFFRDYIDVNFGYILDQLKLKL